jgi:hypothetical protein
MAVQDRDIYTDFQTKLISNTTSSQGLIYPFIDETKERNDFPDLY